MRKTAGRHTFGFDKVLHDIGEDPDSRESLCSSLLPICEQRHQIRKDGHGKKEERKRT